MRPCEPGPARSGSPALLARARAREGFSLLLYGFGSKRALLERFAAEALLDGGVLSVNGLCRGLSARALLLRVASAMRLPRCPDALCAAHSVMAVTAGRAGARRAGAGSLD